MTSGPAGPALMAEFKTLPHQPQRAQCECGWRVEGRQRSLEPRQGRTPTGNLLPSAGPSWRLLPWESQSRSLCVWRLLPHWIEGSACKVPRAVAWTVTSEGKERSYTEDPSAKSASFPCRLPGLPSSPDPQWPGWAVHHALLEGTRDGQLSPVGHPNWASFPAPQLGIFPAARKPS